MAIVTGELYKGFTFGDVSSKDYGVYITQEAAYNAPERDVDVVEIAGRNGAYILDKGRFRNITVSYKCGIALDDEQSFESAIRTFRNALASKAGKYVRLEDEYNPNEYRQAAFLGGIEVDMADRRAGEFTVSFDAMPQRWLKSGETAVTVASGGTLNNPTLFDASPLLEVYGYGEIEIGNGSIVVADDVLVGNVILSNGRQASLDRPLTETIVLDASRFMTGDVITLSTTSISSDLVYNNSFTTLSAAVVSGYSVTTSATKINNTAAAAFITYPEETFIFGTSKNLSSTIEVRAMTSGGAVVVRYSATINYDANTNTITRTLQAPSVTSGTVRSLRTLGRLGRIEAYSTALAYTEPLYFDLSIGEAYAIEGGEPVSINGAVSFGADLPVLPSGANTITYDNTINDLKIIPRWWEV